ncbi:MAG: Si-specific NAD(P)(+) transhydrogenase [Acidiferrobacterales bacterium]
MPQSRFDLIVIGSGPAGQRAAIQAAKLGKRAVIIERNNVIGGVALHTGTIPSKTLREAILYLTGWNQRGFYGHDYRLKSEITVDDLRQRLDITIQHELEIIRKQLSRNNVEVIHGTASFTDPYTINVHKENGNSLSLSADNFLIATGTRPRRPDNIDFDDISITDADGLLNATGLPESVTIIGAGVIGVEYATMLNALEIDVTLINESADILSFVDREIITEFLSHQKDLGMKIFSGEKIQSIQKTKTGTVTTTLENGAQHQSEVLIYTAGRIGCTASLGLENAGLGVNKRKLIKVNENFQTGVPHIFAAGDVIGFPSLASTSMEQGRVVALNAFGYKKESDMVNIPYGIYSVPEISMIGKTEAELQEENIPYVAGKAHFQETARGQILGLDSGMLKLLVHSTNQHLLGVHIMGYSATELVHIGQSVIKLQGKLDYFLNNIFNYPTLAGAYKIAALDAWNHLQN